jgi:hypothetical protein
MVVYKHTAHKIKSVHALLRKCFSFHHHLALKVELALVPMGAVWQVRLAGSRASSQCFSFCFIMCSPLIASGFRGFSFRIWHGSTYLLLAIILIFSKFPISGPPIPLHRQNRMKMYKLISLRWFHLHSLLSENVDGVFSSAPLSL